jgi:hypothetical protein
MARHWHVSFGDLSPHANLVSGDGRRTRPPPPDREHPAVACDPVCRRRGDAPVLRDSIQLPRELREG